MDRDLVVGIDSSTQSTKAIAWTRDGEAVAEGRAPIAMQTPKPGWVEQEPADWWAACCTACQALTAEIDPARVAALAISNQRETVAFLGPDGKAAAPGIVWLDERARDEIAVLSEELGGDWLHDLTGKPPDLTPVIYRLAWMRRHASEMLDQTAAIVDVHGALTGQLTGQRTASWTSADPFGVFDIRAKAWSEPILKHLGLRADQFAALARPGTSIGTVTQAAAAATGLRAGTPVVAGGGDGQCAGLGVDGVKPGVIYLNLGTAIITGAWAPDPMIAPTWRTMTSPTGEGYFLEGCQRAGALFINWFVDTFAGGRDDPDVYGRLEEAAAGVPLGADGLVVSPYLTGCMDPHWDPEARGAFLGLSPSHGIPEMYRASLEALSLESARCVVAMRAAGLSAEKVIAVGGGAQSALWCQMIADATGVPVVRSGSLEASALGAGMSAAVGAGWFDGFDEAASAMARTGAAFTPDPSLAKAWSALSERQARAYRPGGL